MIIPVILENDFEEIVKKLSIAEKFSDLIQIDFVDGKLFEGSTYLKIQDINKLETKAKLDIHLLVEKPMDYLKKKNIVFIMEKDCLMDEIDNLIIIDKIKLESSIHSLTLVRNLIENYKTERQEEATKGLLK